MEPLIPEDGPLTQDILDSRRKIALAHESIPNYLISLDGKTALLYGAIRPSLDSQIPLLPIVKAARELNQKLQRSDHVLYVYGGPAVTGGFQEATQSDLQRLIPFVIGLIVLWLGIAQKFEHLSGIQRCDLHAWERSVFRLASISMTSMSGILPQIVMHRVAVRACFGRVSARLVDGMESIEATRYIAQEPSAPF